MSKGGIGTSGDVLGQSILVTRAFEIARPTRPSILLIRTPRAAREQDDPAHYKCARRNL
jgi:hypothetical protein